MQCKVSPVSVGVGPFLGPGSKPSDHWKHFKCESFLAGIIGFVNIYRTLGDCVLTAAKVNLVV